MKKPEQNSYQLLANAPRKSWLGKHKRLTPSQNRWVRSLLNHWGSMYGGNDSGHLSGGGGMWSQLMSGWSGEQQDRITVVISGLREQGYQGQELMVKAKTILWPKRTLGDLIGGAGDEEEAEFMERMILQSFSMDNPVYEIGRDYYTWNKTIAGMARWLQYYHAPMLTEKQCIDRVRWCIDLFNSAVYFTLNAELCRENEENSDKQLQSGFEAA